jgi:glutamate-1-semialdehyde 2,1-aminomutase
MAIYISVLPWADGLPFFMVIALASLISLFARFFNSLLQGGIYWPPSQFEAAFVSLAHGDNDTQSTISIIEQALKI